MTYAQAAATYQRNAVMTASPEKLVKMLYDGAIKNLEQGRAGLEDSTTARSQEVGQSLSKAMGIIGELRASLDHAAGGEDRPRSRSLVRVQPRSAEPSQPVAPA